MKSCIEDKPVTKEKVLCNKLLRGFVECTQTKNALFHDVKLKKGNLIEGLGLL